MCIQSYLHNLRDPPQGHQCSPGSLHQTGKTNKTQNDRQTAPQGVILLSGLQISVSWCFKWMEGLIFLERDVNTRHYTDSKCGQRIITTGTEMDLETCIVI